MYIEAASKALLDDADVPLILPYTWCVSREHNTLYALTNIRKEDDSCSTLHMHQLFLPVRPGCIIDHRDRNGLNNQRSNLRYATYSQNGANQAIRSGGSSVYKGVIWALEKKKWRARIMVDQRRIHLGYFVEEKDAALAYNEAALHYFGEFASLNPVG